MGLNLPRPTKRRLPSRDPSPLRVPDRPNKVWSADFMVDALHYGTCLRLLNIIDNCTREALVIEVDTSLRSARLVRVFEMLRATRGLPEVLRVDNGPEFLGRVFTDWRRANNVRIEYIQPGKPTQNAFIERFNRSLRREVLDLYLFKSLSEVRHATEQWLIQYNEKRPHDSLGGLPPSVYAFVSQKDSTLELAT